MSDVPLTRAPFRCTAAEATSTAYAAETSEGSIRSPQGLGSKPMENVKWTMAVHRAIRRAYDDPKVYEVIQELGGGQFETMLHLISGLEHEDVAFRRIKHYYLNEMSRRHADEQDLGLRHFTEDELALLGFAPKGKALLTKMRDGDEAAVAQAKSLVKEIKREREDVGLS